MDAMYAVLIVSGNELGRDEAGLETEIKRECKNIHCGWILHCLLGCEVEQSWKLWKSHTAQPVKGSAWCYLLSCSGTGCIHYRLNIQLLSPPTVSLPRRWPLQEEIPTNGRGI